MAMSVTRSLAGVVAGYKADEPRFAFVKPDRGGPNIHVGAKCLKVCGIGALDLGQRVAVDVCDVQNLKRTVTLVIRVL